MPQEARPQRQPPHFSRVYAGIREPGGGPANVGWCDPGSETRGLLEPRLDLRNHSPDGFQWGYEGSGPAQLALALVADATGDDELAAAVYQRFKREIIAPIDSDEFAFNAGAIQDFARSLYAEELCNGHR